MKMKNSLKRFLTENIRVKLFSLFCAAFLWCYVVIEDSYEYVVSIPVRTVRQAEGWIFSEPLPKSIPVRFQGPGKMLFSLLLREKHLEIDLDNRTDEFMISLSLDMLRGIPHHSDLVPMRIVGPDQIRIHLDQFMEKKIPVIPSLTIIPVDGFIQVGPINLDPDSVSVSGPRTLIRNLHSISTQSKLLKNVLKKVEGKIELDAAGMPRISFSSDQVRYDADIQRLHEQWLQDIPVRVIHAPADARVQAIPSTLSLKIQGGVELIRRLKKDEVWAVIDFRNRHRYSDEGIPASITVPEGITFTEVKPKFFGLLIER
ncbi:YbbR-like domain-containing protein [bacterium]|nr:YbbR-like domain-containing protein [bacterium]